MSLCSLRRNDTYSLNVFPNFNLLLIVVVLMLLGHSAKALQLTTTQLHTFAATDSSLGETNNLALHTTVQHTKLIKLIGALQQATTENKKITAAVLTLTLGMLGVHRIYLGTAPYIPAVYLFTFGGGFFILPVIDLVMILSSKDLSKFENNPKLLMWAGD